MESQKEVRVQSHSGLRDIHDGARRIPSNASDQPNYPAGRLPAFQSDEAPFISASGAKKWSKPFPHNYLNLRNHGFQDPF